MSRDAFDFLDHIDAQVEFERRQKMVEEAKAQIERDKIKEAEAKARVDAMSRRANQAILRVEFERDGVEPPFTDRHGNPTVSLSLLKQQGWEVKDIGGQRVLLKPEAIPPGRLQSQV